MPVLPDTNYPRINDWVAELGRQIGTPDAETFLVGHSMGCQAIIRYLGTINVCVGGILLIAAFVSIREGAITDDNDKEMMAKWTDTPIDWQNAKAKSGPSVVVLSDNDPYIDVGNAAIFTERLGARTMVIPKAGHFTKRDGYAELHLALNELLKMINDSTQ